MTMNQLTPHEVETLHEGGEPGITEQIMTQAANTVHLDRVLRRELLRFTLSGIKRSREMVQLIEPLRNKFIEIYDGDPLAAMRTAQLGAMEVTLLFCGGFVLPLIASTLIGPLVMYQSLQRIRRQFILELCAMGEYTTIISCADSYMC